MPLPDVMVAPNGARKNKENHRALPITIAQVAEAAIACKKAGAGGLHAHVRDGEGKHILDAGLYRELLAECERQMPGYYVQITTEAVGMYSPAQQIRLVQDVKPRAVSVALAEITMEGNEHTISDFFHWALDSGIEVQHILYSAEEIAKLAKLVERRVIPDNELLLLFVLGRYEINQQSKPEDLQPFIDELARRFSKEKTIDWAACAFGRGESECLQNAALMGGKVRVGFENNFLNIDGSLAIDNAERVKEIIKLTQF